MQEGVLFEEKQFLGFNKHSLLWRIVMALFCFTAYYWSANPKPVDVAVIELPSSPVGEHSGHLFFITGILILLISALLIYVLHISTIVTETSLVLDGLWTARKVKIDLNTIVSAEKVPYSRYRLNRPVYNLHHRGMISFYTRGNEAVLLTDRDGLKYMIGSQRADELLKVIVAKIKS